MDTPTLLSILAVSVATVCWTLKYLIGTFVPNLNTSHAKVFGSLQESFAEEQRRTRESFALEQHDTRVAFAREQAETRKAFAQEQEDTRLAFKTYLSGLSCFAHTIPRFTSLPPSHGNGDAHEASA